MFSLIYPIFLLKLLTANLLYLEGCGMGREVGGGIGMGTTSKKKKNLLLRKSYFHIDALIS